MYRWTEAAQQIRPVEPREPVRWVRCSKSRRCPICGRPDWCSIAENGSVACCMRIEHGSVCRKDLGHGIGYIHRIHEPLDWATSRPSPPPVSTPPEHVFALDYDAILARWRAATSAADLEQFALRLGVRVDALVDLDVAWCPERQAWAFPMHDERRQVVGIRLRTDSAKFALPGSKAGAFIPAGLDSRSLLLICEGPTDTAAALSLGYQAIGRPSCSGATTIIADLLQAGRRRPVVIVADADGPGRAGARQLADRIVGLCQGVRIITPAPLKDLRAWLNAGATPAALQLRIENANHVSRMEDLPNMAWIKIQVGLERTPEVIDLANLLSCSVHEAVGLCVIFWGWADGATADGRLAKCTRKIVDAAVSRDGFAEAMIKVGWLVEVGKSMTIPNWGKYNGSSSQQRAMWARQKAQQRQRKNPPT